MIRRSLLVACVNAISSCSIASPQPATRPPNVVFILIDDLGWMDLHCQGNDRLDTPHIDALAAQGMRFLDAYAPAPVCSPTRASLLTGKSPARLGITNHIPDRADFTPDDATLDPAPCLDRLPLEHETLAERMREAGWRTAFIGKWHLSGHWREGVDGAGDERFHPEAQGFERNVGGCALGGPPTFWDPYEIAKLPSRKEGEYLPDRLADEAISFIDAHREERFFVCLWTYTVHWPMEAPSALVAKYEERKGPGIKDPRYAAMIEAMDAAIGRVIGAIDERDLGEETLVIFTSDNGAFGGVADNRPLREAKGSLYEGGIRVPLIVRWPDAVTRGSTSRVPVSGTDLFPTILEACGLEPREGVPIDGESLLPVLRGDGELERDAIFFHYPNYAWHRSNRLGGALRLGRHKLIENFDDGSLELYDLQADIGEATNLATQNPDLAAKLVARLRAWREACGARMPTQRRVDSGTESEKEP